MEDQAAVSAASQSRAGLALRRRRMAPEEGADLSLLRLVWFGSNFLTGGLIMKSHPPAHITPKGEGEKRKPQVKFWCLSFSVSGVHKARPEWGWGNPLFSDSCRSSWSSRLCPFPLSIPPSPFQFDFPRFFLSPSFNRFYPMGASGLRTLRL